MKAPDFSGIITPQVVAEVNDRVVQGQIKPLIASGTSPVRGHNRFAAYENPEKYPGDRKPKRPVNLRVSGEMLSDYGAFQKARTLFIGIFDSASESIKNRAIGNNYGTSGAPVRRIVPAPGEQFKVSVVTALREVFAGAIERALRKR